MCYRGLYNTVEMSRNAGPSASQLDMLVSLLEARPWLVRGHARTVNARVRTRQAWNEIASSLNCDGSGCIKTSEQWCKYWKDKKGAVKRKSSQIDMARHRTGGGFENLPELNYVELNILNLMGGESFASGDQRLEINPFQEQEAMNRGEELEESPSILQDIVNTGSQQIQLPATQEYQVEWDLSNIAVAGDTEESVHVLHSPAAGENLVADEVAPVPSTSQQQPQHVDVSRGSETPTLNTQSPRRTPRSRRRTLQRSPRETAARRRLLRRSPPSQRRSEMVRLTERFIAIEERRAEAEVTMARALSLLADNQNKLVDVLNNYLSK